MGKTLITAKINPDLDGVACIYGYAEYLTNQDKSFIGGVFGKPHVEAQYLIDRFSIKDINLNPSGDWDKFILVDMSDTAGVPDVLRASDVVEIIDHRKIYEPEKLFPNAKIQNEMVGAAATLIVEKYRRSSTPISNNSMILLYGAIYSNTLNLKAKVTTDRDLEAVNWLEKQVKIPDNLIHDMFVAKTEAAKANLIEALSDSDFKEWRYPALSFGLPQLECVDLQNIVTGRQPEINAILDKLKTDHQLDCVFLTAIDLEEGFNLFVTPHQAAQKLLSDVFAVTFKNGVAKRPGLILRKEILPLLKEQLS